MYFGEVTKRKLAESGKQYRELIGLRGGVQSPIFPALQEASEGKFSLVKGSGDEPDTIGQNTVHVYDAKAFPFRPAELSNQFQDDPPERYVSDYRELNDKLRKVGMIFTTGCPEIRL